MNNMENQSKLQQFGLDWTVDREPLMGANSNRATGSFGLFRDDNHQWLGTVGKNYEVFQNQQMLDVIQEAANRVEVPISRGGSLGGGRKVYLQAELPAMVIGNSGVNRYITVTNTHDGTAAIGFGSSNTVIVCQNTFYRAYREIEKFRHIITAEQRIMNAVKDLKKAISLDDELMVDFHRMSDFKFDETLASRLMKKILAPETEVDKLSSRTKSNMERLAADIETDVKIHGDNLWALFNGVTRYTNHTMGLGKQTERMDSLMFGRARDVNTMTFDEIMKWIDQRSTFMIPVL